MLPLADHHGRFELDLLAIWTRAFAYRRIAEEVPGRYLLEFARYGLLCAYVGPDSKPFAVWMRYEGLPPTKRSASTFPDPPFDNSKHAVDEQVAASVEIIEGLISTGQVPVKYRTGTPAVHIGVGEEEEKEEKKEKKTDLSPRKRVDALFSRYKTLFGRTDKFILSRERKRKIEARIKEGRTDEDFEAAFQGCLGSSYHQENQHDDIELICRDAVHFDRFVGLHVRAPVVGLPDHSKHNLQLLKRKAAENERDGSARGAGGNSGGLPEEADRAGNRSLLPGLGQALDKGVGVRGPAGDRK